MSGLLTGLTSTTDMKSLLEYCNGATGFPAEILRESQISNEGISFVKSMLSPNPDDRPTASNLLHSPWL